MPQFLVAVKPDQHMSEVAASLGHLSQSPDFGDVTFHFGHGVKVKTNKLLLAKSSRLFGQLFELNCACATWLRVSHDVICPDISPDAVMTLLELLHLGSAKLKSSDPEIMSDVQQVAKIFQIDALRSVLAVGCSDQRPSSLDINRSSTSTEDKDSEPSRSVSPPDQATVTSSWAAQRPELELEAENDHDKGEPSELDEPVRATLESKAGDSNRKRKRTEDLDPSDKRPREEGDELPMVFFNTEIKIEDDDIKQELCDDSEEDSKTSQNSVTNGEVLKINVCSICSQDFPTLAKLAQHFTQSHLSQDTEEDSKTSQNSITNREVLKIKVCSVCSQDFPTIAKLAQHFTQSHPSQGTEEDSKTTQNSIANQEVSRVKVCRVYYPDFMTDAKLAQLFTQSHRSLKLKSEIGNSLTDTKEDSKTSLNLITNREDTKRKVCHVCFQDFPTMAKLAQHFTQSH